MKKQTESNIGLFIVFGIIVIFIVGLCYGIHKIVQQDEKQNLEAKRAIGIAYPKDITVVASYSGDLPGSTDIISVPIDTSGDEIFDINATAADIGNDIHNFIHDENKKSKHKVHIKYEGRYGWKIEKIERL